MTLSEISIGDRVQYNGDFTGTGTVVRLAPEFGIDSLYSVGVDFEHCSPDTWTRRLHRLDGALSTATGWYCKPKFLTKDESHLDTTTSAAVLNFLSVPSDHDKISI